MRDMYDDMETVNYNNNANVNDISDAETINYANKNPLKQQKSIAQIKTEKNSKKHKNLKRKTASNKQKNAKKRRIQEDDVVL